LAGGSLTRADIEAWSTEHLAAAATHWTSTAQTWEEHFTTIHTGVLRPGGTPWEGAGADAAAERTWGDLVTVRGAADALHTASGHATNGSDDVAWAKRQALNAIAEAEEDGFTVGQDFAVKDTSMPSLLSDGEDRQSKAREHAHAIQAAVQQLVDSDKQAADRIHRALSPLKGLPFPGQGDGKHDPTVKAVDYHPGEKPGDEADGKPGEKPPAANDPNGLASLLLAPEKPDGAAQPKPGDKRPANAMDLIAGEQAKRDAAAAAVQPGTGPLTPLDALAGKDGKPAADSRYTKNPLLAPIVAADPSVVDQQRAKVDAAQRAVDAAQAKADASVNQSITTGPYNGHDLNDSNPLARELFDARHNLTEQTKLLQDMNAAAAETGSHQVPVPALPENADRQAFAPGPSLAERAPQEFADSNRTVHELTGGLVPDLFQDAHTATHWREATPAERGQLIADAAGLVPLPGMKLGAEGLEHLAGPAADAFVHGAPSVATHGLTHDAVPPVEHHVDARVGHAPVEVPVNGDHGPLGHGGDAAPPPVDHHGNVQNHVSTESGGPGAWNQELNHPAPNTHYTVDERFNYTTDADGRVNHAEMNYDHTHEPGDRNPYQQRIAGGDDRLPGDHGGHIFGTQFGGPGEGINITAMRDTLNAVGQRDYYNLEQQWRAYADAGGQVQVKVDIAHPEGSMRPETYSVETYVDGQLKSTYHFDN